MPPPPTPAFGGRKRPPFSTTKADSATVSDQETSAEPVLRVSRTCSIPRRELRFKFTPSGGPGGQHANRSNTRVEVTFDVAESPSLGPVQRSRLVAKFGPVVRVVADDERSQLRNRELAVERLRSRLADALHIERPRRPTKPSRGAKERRLEDKRRRSSIKQSRQAQPGDD